MSEDKFKPIGEGLIRASNKRVIRKTRKVEESKVFRRASMVVGVILVIATLIVIAVAVVFSIKNRPKPEQGKVPEKLERMLAAVPQVTAADETITVDQEEIEREAEKLKNLTEHLIKLGSASSADELIPLIADGEKFRADIETYLESHSLAPFQVIRRGELNLQGKSYPTVFARVGAVTRVLVIQPDTGLVDWESLAGSNSHYLQGVIEESQGEGGVVVRGLLDNDPRSEYFNYDYSDRDKWMSLRFIFPASERSITCYIDRESAVFNKISGLYEQKAPGDTSNLAVVLRLKAKDQKSAERKQFELVEIVAESWFLPDQPEISALNGGKVNRQQSESE